MKSSTALLSMLGLWACLLADPKAVRAASPGELQKTYDSAQQEIKANADRIAALQNKLDKMPRKSAQAGGGGAGSNHDDFTSTQKEIVDLKNRNNDLFDKQKAAGDRLRSIGRDPDQPPPTDFAGLPHINSSPWAKRDNGDIETALINFPPDEHISPPNLGPGRVLHHQGPTGHNVATIPKHVTETTASVSPMMPDPAIEQAIDEKVRKQRPEVDVLMNGSPAEPEASPPVPVLASVLGSPAAEPVPSAQPSHGVDWTSIVIGTIIVGGAVAAGVAAGSNGGGNSSGGGYPTSGHPTGGGAAGFCH